LESPSTTLSFPKLWELTLTDEVEQCSLISLLLVISVISLPQLVR